MIFRLGVGMMLFALVVVAGGLVAVVVSASSERPSSEASVPSDPRSATTTPENGRWNEPTQEPHIESEPTTPKPQPRTKSPKIERDAAESPAPRISGPRVPAPEVPAPKAPPAPLPPVPALEAPAPPASEPPPVEAVAEAPVEPLPVVEGDWPAPSEGEVREASREPRRYASQGTALALTIEAIGLYGVPVINEESPTALDAGVIHIPETPMPWSRSDQKNVYLAGHRIGYPSTGSRLVFYELDELETGDRVVLRARSGAAYEYRVTEVFVVDPYADWVFQPVAGRDMLTLQTCTPIPTFENRLIVRADRVVHAGTR